MSHRSLRLIPSLFFSILLLVLLALTSAAPARAAMKLRPVDGLLNPDGTLNLAAQPEGAVDLQGWNVALDLQRGPVFSPASRAPDSASGPLSAPASGVTSAPDAVGDWSPLGSGLDGSLTARVLAFAVSGTDLYVGGGFQAFSANYDTPLPAARYVAKWDGTNWSALGARNGGFSSLQDEVFALAVIGTDVYVGGRFTDVNNYGTVLTAADYIAKWDGTNWSALGSNGAGNGVLNRPVRALAVIGTDLYVGGDFTDLTEDGYLFDPGDYIAKWDGTNWQTVGNDAAGGGSLNGRVVALAVNGLELYVSGNFTDVNNGGTVLTAADFIAKWNGTSWSALGSNGGGNGVFIGGVYALAVSGTNLYVGGEFRDLNNNGTVLGAADNVARWDGSNWSALGSNGGGDGSLDGSVYALAVSGTNLYVGGFIYNLNNGGTALTAVGHIAKWDGTNWSAVGTGSANNGSLNSFVYALAVRGTDVYAGGAFTNVNNNSAVHQAADNIAKWDGANWSALGGQTQGVLNGSVKALAVSGTDVYVGGDFTNLNIDGIMLPAGDYIAKWNGASWSALGSNGDGNGSLNGSVNALAVSGTDLYVGGNFSDVNNNGTALDTADFIAKWDGANWSALGSNSSGNSSLGGQVYALAVSGTDLYIGGDFTDVNNNGTLVPAADYIAKWDGANWSALGSGIAGDGSINNEVYALAVSGAGVYVGGAFTNVNNNGTELGAADYIAKWDGTNWSALGTGNGGDGSLNNDVYALAVSGTDVYAGGPFTNLINNGIMNPYADYIAKWDGTNWAALGTNLVFGDGSLNATVNALAISGSNVYVGGHFSFVYSGLETISAADYVAKWNGTNWAALGSNGAGSGSLNSTVNALALSGNAMYAGGAFTNVNNRGTVFRAGDYVARVQIAAPTAATLAKFSARFNAKKEGVRIKWSTATQLQVLGFNLWRREGKSKENPHAGKWKQMNKNLIAAKSPGDIAGARYARSDKKVKPGKTYSYKLEIVQLDGTSEWSEVVKVKP